MSPAPSPDKLLPPITFLNLTALQFTPGNFKSLLSESCSNKEKKISFQNLTTEAEDVITSVTHSEMAIIL